VDLRKNVLLREAMHVEMEKFLNESVSSAESTHDQIRRLNSYTRRVLDGVFALVVLILLSPVMVLIACAIRCESRGPVFFTQYRTGYMGRRFKMYKFRTMVENAESMKAEYKHLNLHAAHSPDFKIKNDPRITRVGAFLRKCSLDEIPQFWNVVLGNMRVVGPRPTSFPADVYESGHLSRLIVFPGLTGMWQISGRSDTSFEERVEIDRRYIMERGFILDMKILLQTPFAVIKGDGAY
jgi:lipopolysaccharide/colanic/teichoic acid biosynthesis glycosyltransferase